ncbi:MAG: PD-(D/E)XK nuclease family protein, partial [Gemmatimonadota bacterium]|nr:PD-(D/E)XK nuclease family protein [Gemmatimonadota bacterium]
VPRIVDELGILPHAVAGELGSTRAGAVLYALDALRTAGLRGECSLPEAVEVLEMALAQEVDTPLVPGRGDVVRVMNLHKAKGLEAKVVVLAYPLTAKDHAPDRHIRRDADGRATGFFEVTDPTERTKPVIARPSAWAEHMAKEVLYQAAERIRLLYVAATRAAEELVVARCVNTEGSSVWGCFQPVLDDPDVGAEIEIATLVPPAREAVRETVISITDKIRETASRRTALGRPSYRAASVTSRVKSKPIAFPVLGAGRAETSAEARGPEWGRAVHQALELAARGVLGHALRLACRGFLVDEGRPQNDHGNPLELDELLGLVDALQRSAVWRRSRVALQVVVEAPFVVSFSAAEAKTLSIPGVDVERPPREIVEGVIDLAFEEPDGWVIADYKTDVVSDAEALQERIARYRAQVDLYACCWERLTGKRVKEKVLIFTDTGSEMPWQGSSLAAPSPSAGVGDPLPPLA